MQCEDKYKKKYTYRIICGMRLKLIQRGIHLRSIDQN